MAERSRRGAASFDLLVVGSGAAGLSAALRAAELGARTAVLTAGPLLAGSSPRAQGGVAAAVGADDAPALHAADTLAVGAGLNDATAVDVLTREGSRSVRQLWDEGVPFEDDLGLEAGHARRRILHAGGGATGQVLTSALLERALAEPRITLFDHSPVAALLTPSSADNAAPRATRDRPTGAADGAAPANPDTPSSARACITSGMHAAEVFHHDSGEDVIGVRAGAREFFANAVILATGGYAALWGRSTNAPETRGVGLALAWLAGAALADLEFVQFHPTALSLPGRPAFLLSEALRGEGARLVDESGRDVVDPLLPRDVVARALHRQLRHGPVYLTLRHLDPVHVRAQFGQIAARLDEFGLDITRDRLPVAPAAHYCMGGIRTDTWGRTTVAGLYAAGEVACSGVQGANRLASNSLLECLVFGARAAEAALSDPPSAAADFLTQPLPAHLPEPNHSSEPNTVNETRGPHRIVALDAAVLGRRLDRDVAVERHGTRLAALIAELPGPEASDTAAPDLLLASLIARAAWLRTESRGAHFRTDFPNPNAQFRGRIHWRRDQPPAFEEVVSTP